MNENPYQPPRDVVAVSDDEGDHSLEEKLRAYHGSRRRWSHRCWIVGVLLVVAGVFGFFLRIPLASTSDWTLALIESGSACLILLGVGTAVLGPISWFWLRRGG